MKKYVVGYCTKNGDYAKVWVYAESASEAQNKVRCEYWDVEQIEFTKEV